MVHMATPDVTSAHPTLLSAAARFDQLSMRDALASMAEEDAPGSSHPLTMQEALELLALGEVIARKAAYGRQLTVRSARAAGASWSQIGAGLGISKQAAWEAWVIVPVPVAVVMRMVFGVSSTLTGRISRHSTTGLAVVAAASLATAQFDEGVGRGHPQLGGERGVEAGPVGDHVRRVGSWLGFLAGLWHETNVTH